MLILKGECGGQRNIWASEMLGENAQIVAKLATVVNIRGARIHCIPRDTICISMNKNHLHCYQLSTIYRAVKQLKDRERVRQCRGEGQIGRPLIFLVLIKVSQFFSILLVLFASHCFAECSQHSRSIRVEINKRENRPKIEKINKTKISFFEKFNKINRLLARLRKERDRYQLQYQE